MLLMMMLRMTMMMTMMKIQFPDAATTAFRKHTFCFCCSTVLSRFVQCILFFFPEKSNSPTTTTTMLQRRRRQPPPPPQPAYAPNYGQPPGYPPGYGVPPPPQYYGSPGLAGRGGPPLPQQMPPGVPAAGGYVAYNTWLRGDAIEQAQAQANARKR
jgi:hypothetical protein